MQAKKITPGTAPPLDAQGRLDVDLSCAGCGYNLRTQAPDGACPECGGAISASILNWYRFELPGLQRARVGALIYAGAFLASPFLVLLRIVGVQGSSLAGADLLPHVLNMAYGCVETYAIVSILSPAILGHSFNTPRQWARITKWAAIGGLFVNYFVEYTNIAFIAQILAPGLLIYEALEMFRWAWALAWAIWAAQQVAFVTSAVGLCVVLSWLGKWFNYPRLAKMAIALWAMPVLTLIGTAIIAKCTELMNLQANGWSYEVDLMWYLLVYGANYLAVHVGSAAWLIAFWFISRRPPGMRGRPVVTRA